MNDLLKLLESCTGPCKLALYAQDGYFWARRGEIKVTQKLIEELRAAIAQHPEQQPDIDAFLGEGRKPVRSLASVMIPSARDPEQQPENDPHMLCVCGHAVVEHTCANDDCGCLAFKRQEGSRG